ncbi:MAG: hypothetical protein R3234_09535 [Thermoanaerobaculia bacterium]|nr:hypothetical protein [Thermoanaerobaculia bacterium]
MTDSKRPGIPEEESYRFADAVGEELEELVSRWLDRLGPRDVERILRNPHTEERIVRILLGERRLLSYYEIRKRLALHPKTPAAQALNLLNGLFWRDLLAAGQDTAIRPQVRRAADLRLADRLGGLAVGERVSIARRASPTLLQSLRKDPSARVVGAMLENPRCTEATLLPMVTSETTPGPVLEVVARNRKWGVRYPIRAALCKNPQTPVRVSLSLLPMLKKRDLRAVRSNARIPHAVQRRARLLLGDSR